MRDGQPAGRRECPRGIPLSPTSSGEAPAVRAPLLFFSVISHTCIDGFSPGGSVLGTGNLELRSCPHGALNQVGRMGLSTVATTHPAEASDRGGPEDKVSQRKKQLTAL